MYTEKHCRLCALKFPITALKNIEDLKNDFLHSSILLYLQIKIADNEKLPQTACLCCCKILSDFERFRTNVKDSQKKLHLIYCSENLYDSHVTKPSKLDFQDQSKNVKNTEDDYENDLDSIDHFLNDFTNDTQDSEAVSEKEYVTTNDSKPENLEIICQNILKIDHDMSINGTNEENNTLNNDHTVVKNLRYKCYKCNIWFKTEVCLQDHFDMEHDTKMKYVCTKCNALFLDIIELKKHLYGHYLQKRSKRLRYKCEICGKKFESESILNAHEDSHLEKNSFPCNECGRKFRLKQQLSEHKFIHRKAAIDVVNDYEVKCEQCDKICKNQFTLERHLLSHIPNEIKHKFECDQCDRKFVSAINLKNHQILHKNEKEREHICDVCGKVFKNKQNLIEHKATHSNERPFKCDECSKTFKTDRVLQRHKLIHSDEKPFGCEVCGKNFRERAGLNTHFKIHTEERPSECNYCHKRFKRKRDLEVHVRQHTGERPFSCLECNHYFSNNSNFLKHLKGKHKLKNVSIANKRSYPFD